VITVTTDEIEDAAITGCGIPEGLTSAEKWLFLCFRNLHATHRLGIISREQGAKEKRLLLKDFKHRRFMDMCSSKTVDLWRGIDLAAMIYTKNPTRQNANGLLEAIYGKVFPSHEAYKDFAESIKNEDLEGIQSADGIM
jgi:hypothetical protein